jgi:hypothetical protein
MATANMEISTSEAATAGHIVEGSKRARRQLERYNGLQHNNDGAFIGDLLRLGSATSEFFGYDDEDGASSYAGNEHVSSDDDTRMEDELPGAEEDDDDDDDDEYLQSIKDRETNGRHHVRRGRHADHDGQACERQVVQHRTPQRHEKTPAGSAIVVPSSYRSKKSASPDQVSYMPASQRWLKETQGRLHEIDPAERRHADMCAGACMRREFQTPGPWSKAS